MPFASVSAVNTRTVVTSRTGIKDCELKEAYDNSFLSETYPDVALSRNTVHHRRRKRSSKPIRICLCAEKNITPILATIPSVP